MWEENLAQQSLIELPTNSYDCLCQQVVTIAFYYKSEFYKILFHEEVHISEGKLWIKDHYFENLKKYYGINMVELEYDRGIKGICLAFFDLKEYPLCKNIEGYEDGMHAILVYAEEKDNYKIYDNFYGVQELLLDKTLFASGVKVIYKIEVEQQIEKVKIDDALIEILERNIVEKWSYLIKEQEDRGIDTKIAMENIEHIFGLIGRSVGVIENIVGNDLWIRENVKIIRKISDQIRKIWYGLKKIEIRYKKVERDALLIKYREILELLIHEKFLRQEIYNILYAEKRSVKNRILSQLKEYWNSEEYSLEDSVYFKHDGVTILRLIVWWEEKNELEEIDSTIYYGKDTYEEFAISTYSFLLSEK